MVRQWPRATGQGPMVKGQGPRATEKHRKSKHHIAPNSRSQHTMMFVCGVVLVVLVVVLNDDSDAATMTTQTTRAATSGVAFECEVRSPRPTACPHCASASIPLRGCLRLGPSMPLSSLSCIVFIVATSLAVHYYCSNRFVPTQTLRESSRYRNLGETDALALRATSYNHAMSDSASKHALRIE